MNDRQTTEQSFHHEVSLLLPWYVIGTLDGVERERVEQHARCCIACRRELALERRTLEVFQRDDALEQSAQAGFQRLHQRIAGTTGYRQPRLSRFIELPARWLRDLHGTLGAVTLRPALLALALAALTGTGGLALLRSQSEVGQAGPNLAEANYQTLSAAGSNTPQLNDIHVIFAPGTDPEATASVLTSVQGRIVDGPNEAGVYTVRLQNVSGSEERQLVLKALRLQSGVILAEAAVPLAVPRPDPGTPR